MDQPVGRTRENAPDGDWLRSWAAKNLPGGSADRTAMVAIASVLDDYPRMQRLAESPPVAEPVPHPGIEVSLASIATSLSQLVKRYGQA